MIEPSPQSGASGRWPWRWFVSQEGAREFYAAPRGFRMTSRLGALYTGTWCRFGRSILRRGPNFVKGFAGHWHRDVPHDSVVSFDLESIGWFLHRALVARPKTIEQAYNWEVDNCEWFGRRTWNAMRRVKFDPASDAFFSFQSECLEAIEPLRDLGVPSVLDLASAGRMDDRMVKQEHERWPGWARLGPDVPERYYQRVDAECQAATLTLVNSEYSRRAWIEQGVPDHKIIVVPLAYEPHGPPAAPRARHDRSLTVLWIGSVILRKGIPYLIEAAKRLRESSVRFVVAGPIGISQQIVDAAPSNVQFIGRVAGEAKESLFRESDIFVIPTMSDGFAITQLEAMAHGLPVIATPNCGDVVTHGTDGLLVPAGDADALAQAIATLDADRSLLAAMSERAIVKSRQFTVRRFGESVNSARDRIAAGQLTVSAS